MGKDGFADKLKQELKHLSKNHYVAAVKTGTEVEDMSFDEIAFIKEIAQDLPIVVKIGGPEARNDIRACLKLKIDTILAPMVETVYALDNFVRTIEEMSSGVEKIPVVAVNIESITAVSNFDNMIATRSFEKVGQVTVGRSDLSRSMHLSIDDPEVTEAAAGVVKRANLCGLITSIGGGISLENIAIVSRKIPTLRINTRHTVYKNCKEFSENSARHLYYGLRFEMNLYHQLARMFSEKREIYLQRAEIIHKRMGNITLLQGNLK